MDIYLAYTGSDGSRQWVKSPELRASYHVVRFTQEAASVCFRVSDLVKVSNSKLRNLASDILDGYGIPWVGLDSIYKSATVSYDGRLAQVLMYTFDLTGPVSEEFADRCSGEHVARPSGRSVVRYGG